MAAGVAQGAHPGGLRCETGRRIKECHDAAEIVSCLAPVSGVSTKFRGLVMNQTFVRRMQKRLEEMRHEILAKLASESSEMRAIAQADDTKDLVDLATHQIDRTALQALGAAELKRLNLIDAALARIREGRYGVCLKTGRPIPEERLEAIPYALYTVEAQKQLERRSN
jgi:DnaK suppressor protein